MVQTHRHMDLVTYRLNQQRGRLSEKFIYNIWNIIDKLLLLLELYIRNLQQQAVGSSNIHPQFPQAIYAPLNL